MLVLLFDFTCLFFVYSNLFLVCLFACLLVFLSLCLFLRCCCRCVRSCVVVVVVVVVLFCFFSGCKPIPNLQSVPLKIPKMFGVMSDKVYILL